MPCWPWHKTPPFSAIFSITAPNGGGEKRFSVTFLYLFMVFWWYSSLILNKLSHVKNLSSFSFFQEKPSGNLLMWGKCKIYREIRTGAGWKSFQSSATFLFIPLVLHGLSWLLHFWTEGTGKRVHWFSALCVCTCTCEMQKICQSLCVPSQLVCCRKMIHAEQSIRVTSLVMRARTGVFKFFIYLCLTWFSSLNEVINCFHCHVNQNM